MNFERCWWDRRGVFATVLVLLVFVTSVAWTPARTDRPVFFFAGLVPSASVLYTAGTAPAKAILPAASALSAPLFEHLLPEVPSGTFYRGMMVFAGMVAPRFAQRKRPDLSGTTPFPRHAFLHVYRC